MVDRVVAKGVPSASHEASSCTANMTPIPPNSRATLLLFAATLLASIAHAAALESSEVASIGVFRTCAADDARCVPHPEAVEHPERRAGLRVQTDPIFLTGDPV